MAKLENLKDKKKFDIVSKEIKEFNKLIDGHSKLLYAIGQL